MPFYFVHVHVFVLVNEALKVFPMINILICCLLQTLDPLDP